MPDDGMNQPPPQSFDLKIIDRLIKALGNDPIRYLEVAYNGLRLQEEAEGGLESRIYERVIETVKTNDMPHLKDELKEEIHNLYAMNKEFADARKDLIEIKEWIATQRKH